MNSHVYLILTVIGGMGILLFFLGRNPRKSVTAQHKDQLDLPEDASSRHATHWPQIRQALRTEDLAYVSSLGLEELARRLYKDRRRIALDYLPALRQDFERLLHLAQVIASLSPQVNAGQEWERFSLMTRFRCNYELIRFALVCNLDPLSPLVRLNELVSAYSMRIETAMKELGERAALATEMASSMNGRGVGAI